MRSTLGPQHWWPARTPFEVIVGAILAQNTAWRNVERAIANLRRAGLLAPRALERVPLTRLARLVRPSGYFRQKARKLKAFVRFLRREHAGSLARMFRTPVAALRQQLLAVHGIGPETADSILLYAGGKPVFVVDAYTRRILLRHGLIREPSAYEEVRQLFENHLPADPALWNEYHALLVNVGKHFCRPHDPLCNRCPLEPFLQQPQTARNRRTKIERGDAPAGSGRRKPSASSRTCRAGPSSGLAAELHTLAKSEPQPPTFSPEPRLPERSR